MSEKFFLPLVLVFSVPFLIVFCSIYRFGAVKAEFSKHKEENEETIMGGWSTRCEVLKQSLLVVVDLLFLCMLTFFGKFL